MYMHDSVCVCVCVAIFLHLPLFAHFMYKSHERDSLAFVLHSLYVYFTYAYGGKASLWFAVEIAQSRRL